MWVTGVDVVQRPGKDISELFFSQQTGIVFEALESTVYLCKGSDYIKGIILGLVLNLMKVKKKKDTFYNPRMFAHLWFP